MEDPGGQLVAVCQCVCKMSTAAHHLFHSAAIESQELADFEAQYQWKIRCQHLLYADLQSP